MGRIWRAESRRLIWADDRELGDELSFEVKIIDQRVTLDDIADGLDLCADEVSDSDGEADFFWMVCCRTVYRIVIRPSSHEVEVIAKLGPGRATYRIREDGRPEWYETGRLVERGCDHESGRCVSNFNPKVFLA